MLPKMLPSHYQQGLATNPKVDVFSLLRKFSCSYFPGYLFLFMQNVEYSNEQHLAHSGAHPLVGLLLDVPEFLNVCEGKLNLYTAFSWSSSKDTGPTQYLWSQFLVRLTLKSQGLRQAVFVLPVSTFSFRAHLHQMGFSVFF